LRVCVPVHEAGPNPVMPIGRDTEMLEAGISPLVLAASNEPPQFSQFCQAEPLHHRHEDEQDAGKDQHRQAPGRLRHQKRQDPQEP